MSEAKQDLADKMFILDIGIAKAVETDYPISTDKPFVNLLRYYYACNNTAPKMSDFKPLMKDDLERPCYGPIDVRVDESAGVKAKDAAIYKFMRNVLKFRLPTDKTQLDADALKYQESPSGLRQIFFIYADIDSVDAFSALRQRFHANEERLYHNDFMVVGARRKKDLAVCEHRINREDMLKLKPSELAAQEIENHITKCLKKPATDEKSRIRPHDQTPFEIAKRLWPCPRTVIDSEDRSVVTIEQWRAGHPLFSRFKYRDNGLISLTSEEIARLDKPIRELYDKFDRGQGSPTEAEAMAKFFRPKIAQMRADFEVAGYDITPFTLYKKWTAAELLKAYVSPPIPRAPVDAVWPKFDLQLHSFGVYWKSVSQWVSDAEPSGAAETELSDAMQELDLLSSGTKAETKTRGKKKGAAGGKGSKSVKTMLIVGNTPPVQKFLTQYYGGCPGTSRDGKFFMFKGDIVLRFIQDLSVKLSFPYEGLLPRLEPIGAKRYDDLIPAPSAQFGIKPNA